ncbi:hypothetical protein BJ996_001719 [Streptomyces phaeogriseichromatogenes]|nr:hypothetical protein [Streptomyces murinus]
MALSVALLAEEGDLTQRIHEGVVARGFAGLRPAHGSPSRGSRRTAPPSPNSPRTSG